MQRWSMKLFEWLGRGFEHTQQKHKRHEVEQQGGEGFSTHSIATPPTQVGSSLVLDTSLMAKIL